MNQTILSEHDRAALIVYWNDKEQFERYRHTAERNARIHAKRFDPHLERVIHLLESGEQITVTELSGDKEKRR